MAAPASNLHTKYTLLYSINTVGATTQLVPTLNVTSLPDKYTFEKTEAQASLYEALVYGLNQLGVQRLRAIRVTMATSKVIAVEFEVTCEVWTSSWSSKVVGMDGYTDYLGQIGDRAIFIRSQGFYNPGKKYPIAQPSDSVLTALAKLI